MFLKQAMRYYRLWIYSSNTVLLVSVLVFLSVAAAIVSHPYLRLVPTPEPYHPTLLYGYLALFLQAGIVQAIGCIGAFRLNRKLLRIYLLVLMVLVAGDMMVGVYWLAKLTTLNKNLQPYLSMKIKKSYTSDEDFAYIWNSLQSSSHCCGAVSPLDFHNNVSYTILPSSCCHIRPLASKFSVHRAESRFKYIKHEKITVSQRISDNYNVKLLKDINATCRQTGHVPYMTGCAANVGKWYRQSVETLMVLGFCVITFIKVCFVGLLKFEIQEMIQKIRVLQGESVCNQSSDLVAALGMMNHERQSDAGISRHHDDLESNKTTPHLLLRHNHLSGQDGVESDTNSNCALITDTPVRNSFSTKKPNGNNNDFSDLQDLRHIRQTQI